MIKKTGCGAAIEKTDHGAGADHGAESDLGVGTDHGAGPDYWAGAGHRAGTARTHCGTGTDMPCRKSRYGHWISGARFLFFHFVSRIPARKIDRVPITITIFL